MFKAGLKRVIELLEQELKTNSNNEGVQDCINHFKSQLAKDN